jgi:hypothetical protein
MNKQWEPERSRIEHANDARITLTIALHGDHAWEMLLEDSNSYHSISHGWASDNLQDWEAVIAPALRRLFLNGRLRLATKAPIDAPDGSSVAVGPLYDPPLCSPATRTEDNLTTVGGSTQSRLSQNRSHKQTHVIVASASTPIADLRVASKAQRVAYPPLCRSRQTTKLIRTIIRPMAAAVKTTLLAK